MYDAEIGVVGAGPAGARAAELLARQGVDVIVLDPRVPWEKPCGGGLTASAFRNVPDLIGVQPLARRIDAVRLEASPQVSVTVPLDVPLFVIPRVALSQWQLDRAVSQGARFEASAVKRIEPSSMGWLLTMGTGEPLRVRRLIGADGAASGVRKVVAPKLRIELAPTRVLFAHGAGGSPQTIVMRFFAAVPGYAWNFPRPGHRSIGLGLEPGDWSRSQLDADLESYWDTWGRCECVPATRAGAVIGTAFHQSPYDAIGGDDFALLGDAAGLADPATGEGIQNALRTADLVAEAYARDRSFRAYPRMAHAAFEPEFRVARRVRRYLYTWNLPVRLIEAARRHATAYALLAAIVRGGNEHDPHLWRNWLRELRRDKRAHTLTKTVPAAPAAADCCPDDSVAGTCTDAATAGDVCQSNTALAYEASDDRLMLPHRVIMEPGRRGEQ